MPGQPEVMMETRERLDNLAKRQARLNGDRAARAARTLDLPFRHDEISVAELNTALLDLLVDAIHLGEEAGVAVELQALLQEAADIFYVERARTRVDFLSDLEPSFKGDSSPSTPPEGD